MESLLEQQEQKQEGKEEKDLEKGDAAKPEELQDRERKRTVSPRVGSPLAFSLASPLCSLLAQTVRFVVSLSFAVNVLLFLLKVWASIMSLS